MSNSDLQPLDDLYVMDDRYYRLEALKLALVMQPEPTPIMARAEMLLHFIEFKR